MQQTSKYQFNLIDSGDTFSPAPLNDNMEKVEAQFGAMEESLTELAQSVDNDLSAITAALGSEGQNARITWGSYSGNGSGSRTLTFPFRPALVVIGGGSSDMLILVQGAGKTNYNAYASGFCNVSWGGSGGSWTATVTTSYHNASGNTYYYAAIGYEE